MQWPKTGPIFTSGKLIHYAPKNGVYVYGRIKDNKTVLVMLNSATKEQKITLEHFNDLTNKFKRGTDVISRKAFQITGKISITAKGNYILELD